MSILIKNGHILDPKSKIDLIGDLLIVDGKIAQIGVITETADEIIDAKGMVVASGFIDAHIHLRDPGFTHKEDILTGTDAAAAGGFTGVACMPNTKPCIDSVETIKYILDKAKTAKARVYPIACITKGMQGEELCDYSQLIKAGAVGISDDGRPVENAAKMQSAMEIAYKNHFPIISHCEDLNIINGGIINKGEVSEKLGVKGMDRTSEDSITAREIAIAAATDTAIHIAHVSTKGSVALIRDAKARGVKVTCETAPHYMIFTDKELLKQNANYRMSPPLREEEDRLAIIEGVRDGTFDMISTDHAPHSKEEKSDFFKAPNGIIGLETSFAACYTALVAAKIISLERLITMMSVNPAKLLNVSGGSLEVGQRADVTIFNDDKWVVTEENLHSKSKNSPFIGMELTGMVHYTIMNGNITFKR
ncbi:MAG: dihydroorotase [Oscillospiraceae bacterium]